MYRYIALFWNHLSEPSIHQANHLRHKLENNFPGLKCAICTDDAAIYFQTSDPGVFECNQAGELITLGKVFTKEFGVDAIPERAKFSDTSSERICNSQGRALVNNYWGRYVAFGHDRKRRQWFAMRDPTGEIPCQMTVMEHVALFFSNMEDCLKLQLGRYTINWSYLTSSLILPFRDQSETGFNEITTLEAAEVVAVHHGKPADKSCHWDIAQIAAENPITDIREAVQLARTTLLGCIGALASQHTDIQLKLSGGLDSSIVLAGLLNAPSKPNVECVHHYDSNVGADEREYARMAVAGASESSGRMCRLIEYERKPYCSLEEVLNFPRTARLLYCTGHLLHRDVGSDSALSGIATRFTGVGGDAVFLRFKGNGGAIDYAWQHGINLTLLRVALETAQAGDSFYGVLKDAIRYGFLKKPFFVNKRWGSPCDWLKAIPSKTELQPAWLRHTRSKGSALSPSKLSHLGRMVFPTNILDPYEGIGGFHGVSPINSQPVVELFARIPLHILMADGEDRTIARRAFAGLLPERLLSRRVKCYLDDHAVSVTQYHRDFISSMLVDGILAQKGYIDSAAADDGIKNLNPENTSQVLGIFGPQLNIEAWLRKWS